MLTKLDVKKACNDAAEIEQNSAKNADLITVDIEQNPVILAAKNIRILLKKRFKGFKFSVRKREHNCIDVTWCDGPTKEAVNAVIGKFQRGCFDTMSDCYKYNDSEFNRNYGGVKYLFPERSLSDALITEAIELLREECGKNAVPADTTLQAYREGHLGHKGYEFFYHGLSFAITERASKIDKTV